MKPDKLDFFRALLQTRINELLNGAERTVQEMTDEQENFPDPNDRASLESDRNFELRIRDRERKLIAKMQEALKRIDDGTFGVCDSCGGPISEKPGPSPPTSRPFLLEADMKRKKSASTPISSVGPNIKTIPSAPRSRQIRLPPQSPRAISFWANPPS